MIKLKIAKVVKGLKALNNNYIDTFNMIYEKDSKESKQNLKPGETVPPIILEVNKMLLKEIQHETRAKATELLKELKDTINKVKTETPPEKSREFIDLFDTIASIEKDYTALVEHQAGQIINPDSFIDTINKNIENLNNME